MAHVLGCYPTATPENRARVFKCGKVSQANRYPVSSRLSSRFAEARFSHINTNQLHTANQGRGGVSANQGPRQSGAEAGYVFIYKQALRVGNLTIFTTHSIVPWCTATVKSIDMIGTCCSIFAWIATTFIDV